MTAVAINRVKGVAAPLPVSKPQRSQRKMSWDLIRVLAVLAVILQHQTALGPAVLGLQQGPLMMPFQFGASSLLVISAYFACVTIRRGGALKWWWKRIARLLPAYFAAVFLVFFVTQWFAPEGWFVPDWRDLLGNLLLIQNFSPEVEYVDPSFWTLPLQVLAFSVAAVLWSTGKIGRRRLPIVLWAAILLPVVLTVSVLINPELAWTHQVYEGLGLHRAHLFAAGAAIWLWGQRAITGRHLCALIALVLLAHMAQPPATDSVGGMAIMLLLICAAARLPDWNVPGLRLLQRPVSWLAGISYGVYLLHQQIGYLVSYGMGELGVRQQWIWLSVVIGVAVVLGWLLTVFVERPMYRLLTGDRRA